MQLTYEWKDGKWRHLRSRSYNIRIISAVIIAVLVIITATVIIRTAFGMRKAVKDLRDRNTFSNAGLLAFTALDCLLCAEASLYSLCAVITSIQIKKTICHQIHNSYESSALIYFSLNAYSICILSRSLREEFKRIFQRCIKCWTGCQNTAVIWGPTQLRNAQVMVY
ncbi:hypothetical protein RB195_001471 [Necator americanus]|uniref:G-protein coupled receptors family 1 profile domain-containing protein n=1 Tax=Necator americanus TaxID=51031 RepID=A0ABR1DEG7_NECAM